jgi:hypothetical protein
MIRALKAGEADRWRALVDLSLALRTLPWALPRRRRNTLYVLTVYVLMDRKGQL